MPALKEREATRKTSTAAELAGSIVLHVLLFGGAIYSGFLFHDRGQKWGDSQEMAGAVQATMVSSIPLPPRVPPRQDNVLASDKPSIAPPPVKEAAEPPPKPTDVPVRVKKPEKEPPKKVTEKPSPVVPKIQQPPKVEPQKATSGTTGGVRTAMLATQSRVGTSAVAVTDQSFGARFGYYVRQMNQRISQQWVTATLDPGAQGRRVYMTFRIDRSGQLSDVRIVQSSGDRTLDSSAVRTLERIDTLAPLPEEYSGSYITVQYYFEPS
ncbi:TonB family protein [Terriglobus sp.]|uniref:TonB family protein n=1 Tax=Terriglobus sp. TaxID=1889013 RepID=UPI003B009C1B